MYEDSVREGRKQTNRTQTASDLWRMEVSEMKMHTARISGCDSSCYVIGSLVTNTHGSADRSERSGDKKSSTQSN